MENIIIVVGLVFGILQIILFFKVWGMTNDMREIKNKYMLESSKQLTSVENDGTGITQGTLVVELKTENQMKVGEKTAAGKYKCYSGLSYVGDFGTDEFMEFNEWVEKVYKK